MAVDAGRGCPTAERLAEYVDGVLDAAARADVERHLTTCADCRDVVAETAAFVASERERTPLRPAAVVPFRRRRWVAAAAAALAAAAAVVIAIRVARPEWLGLSRGDRPELQELIAALANEPTRPVEGRLSGGFRYAPAPSAIRGAGEREVSPEVRIAAAKVESAVRGSSNPRDEAAIGVAYLAVHDFEPAIATLEGAATRAPADASIQNDLAAAYLARGRRFNRRDDFDKARAAAEAALRLTPTMPEAAFNRALAYTYLNDPATSSRAWDEFVRLDPSSPWTREVAEHRAPASR